MHLPPIKHGVQSRTCMVKSRTPAAAIKRITFVMNAMNGMDSSWSSGNSRTSIAAKTGCWSSSLCTIGRICQLLTGCSHSQSCYPQCHLDTYTHGAGRRRRWQQSMLTEVPYPTTPCFALSRTAGSFMIELTALMWSLYKDTFQPAWVCSDIQGTQIRLRNQKGSRGVGLGHYLVTPMSIVTTASYRGRTISYEGLASCTADSVRSISFRHGSSSPSVKMGKE
jgi:hypothetical protein